MESEEDASMDDLLFETFSAMDNGRESEELENGGDASSEAGSDDDGERERFLAEVERIEEDMDRMKALLRKVQERDERSESGVGCDGTRDADIAQGSQLARGVEAKLEALERESAESLRLDGVEDGNSARTTTASNLRARFREIMEPFEAFRERVLSENKDTSNLRSDDTQKRRRVDEAEPPIVSVSAETGAGRICPPHPGYMHGMCFRCGEKKSTVPNNDPVQDRVGLRYIHEGLEVSELEASRLRNAELRRVTGKQKLLLVVDLDHTMLNSARFAEVQVEERTYLSSAYHGSHPNNNSGANVDQKQGNVSSLHQLINLGMWTKLRPFAHRFLEEASRLYEMYVYTMGEKVYALAMAKLLDPSGLLFGGRIISQTDSTKRHTKDLDVVLGAESAVVILDDTEAVWPKHKSNLILMERYHFFSSSCNQFRLRTPSLAQIHRDESEMDGTLANTLKTLKAIHHEFFNGHRGKNMKRRPSQEYPDVREVIRSIRNKLLAGCSIVFSRVFPTGLQNPEFHPLWQLAVELGARCKTSCDRSTTHVVALDRGTDKARWAKQHGIYLVHPKWVEAASYQWCRPIEGDYPVTDDVTSAQTMTTFSRSILVEPVVVEVRNHTEDELLIDVGSSIAEAGPVIAIGSDKPEAGPLIDMESEKEKSVSTTENYNQDFGVSSDIAGRESLNASGSDDVRC